MNTEKKFTAIGYDIIHCPRLYTFLNKLSVKAKKHHGFIPYEMLQNSFWVVLDQFDKEEREMLVDSFILNLDHKEIILKREMGKTTSFKIKKRILNRLEKLILKHLAIEVIVGRIKNNNKNATLKRRRTF